MLEKIGQLKWRLSSSSRNQQVPPTVVKTLISQFRMDSNIVSSLRCLAKRGSYAGDRVTQIRIFDPGLIVNRKGDALKYDDLTNYKVAVLFEGNIKDDQVYLSDRRTPKGVVENKNPG